MTPRTLAALGVNADTCLQIQCGLITQAEAGLQTLYDCAAAGYAGARSALDPLCQELAGGGPTVVYQQAQEAAAADTLPDSPDAYQADDGSIEWQPYETAAGGQSQSADTDQASAASADQERNDTGEQDAGQNEMPETLAEFWELIGSPDYQFSETPPANTEPGIGGEIAQWIERASDSARRAPWWLWVVVAAAVYYATRNRSSRRTRR